MLFSLDLVAMPPGRATAEFLRVRRSLDRNRPTSPFVRALYLASFTTFPGPVPSLTSFGVLGAWNSTEELDRFRSSLARSRNAHHGELTLQPYKTRGTWDAGTLGPADPAPPPPGPVLAITRATTAAPYHLPTWRSNPNIVRSLRGNEDVLWSQPFADRALGVIGTFSLWPDDASLVRFAYGKDQAHAPVIGAAKRGRWLPESWFGRATVLASRGSWPGWPDLVSEGVREQPG